MPEVVNQNHENTPLKKRKPHAHRWGFFFTTILDNITLNKDKKNRLLKHIAYLQIIGIVLVVIGHSFHECPESNFGTDLLIYKLMYSFRMPLFLFVSGYLLMYTSLSKHYDHGSIHFIKNKILRLLLPFAVLTLIAYIPRSMLSTMADDSIPLSIEFFIKSLYHSDYLIIPYFWFLQSSFTLLIGCYLYIKTARKMKIPELVQYALLLLIFLLLPILDIDINYKIFSVGQTIHLGLFFVLGMIFSQYEHVFVKYVSAHSVIAIIVFATIWIVAFFISGGSHGNIFLYKIAGLAGIFMCFCFCRWLVNNHIFVLDRFIGVNYMIFLLSWFFNTLSQQVLHHYVEMPWYLFTVISIISGIYCPYLIYKTMKCYRHTPAARTISFLLGQNIVR